MKSFIFLLCIIPILSYTQDKDKIAKFNNEVYGDDYYFVENNVGSVSLDELDEDWENDLSIEERNSYKIALKYQIKTFYWQDIPLKKAILCIDGKPIVSEKNIPIEAVTFVPKKIKRSEKKNFGYNQLLTIYYSGNELTEKKKNKLYVKFLKNLSKSKKYIEYRMCISQPIFFGNNYALSTRYSKSFAGSAKNICVFKFESNVWKKIGCERIGTHDQPSISKINK